MADGQPLNATFFAFRKRDRGGVLTMATIAYVVLALGIFGVFAVLNWQAFADYIDWITSMNAATAGADPGDPAALQAAMTPPASVMALAPAYCLLMLVTYILLAAYEAACLRWMIHGETGGVFGLSLGADTWRVYFGYWVWFFLTMAIYIVLVILMAGFGVGMGVAAQQSEGGGFGVIGIVGFAVMLIFMLAWLYVAVRLAPAAATSVARRRFSFFDAWKVTKGRFWALLGAFLLLLVIYIGLCLVLGGAAAFTFASSMQNVFAQSGAADSREVMNAMFSSPGVWIPLAAIYSVLIIAVMVLYVALFGINARAASLALEEGKIAPAAQ